MDFDQDIPLMLADFGSAGTLGGLPVLGVHERDTVSALNAGARVGQSTYLLAAASVPASVHKASLVIPQGAFTVRDSVAEDDGLVRLLLEKVA